MTALAIADGFTLPISAVTETFGILAVKRAGKSNAAVVIAEEMHAAGIPWVAVDPKGDWWGVRSNGEGTGPGLAHVVVFGGLHGDVPLEPASGKLVADLIAEQRLTAVLDVSEMQKADQRRFLTDFATRLYQKNREPLHVFCEEADEYIPQTVRGENAKLVGAWETLVKRGGFRGIGVTLITQRSASLNKDVLTQVGTLFAMRTPSPQDRKAILGWVSYHDAAAALVDDLPMLKAGDAVVFSPQWLPSEGMDDLYKIHFRQRLTFDSGATPKLGTKRIVPTRLAEVDLDAIKAAMADVIERVAADDPAGLRRRIKELEAEVAGRAPREIEVKVRIPEIPAWLVPEMTDLLAAYDAAIEQAQAVRAVAHVLRDRIQVAAAEGAALETAALAPFRDTTGGAPIEVSFDHKPPTVASGGICYPAPSGKPLGKTPRRLLGILVQQGPLTPKQLAARSCMSAKGGSFERHLTTLRAEGMIERKQPLTATPEGIAVVGDDVEPLPTGPDLFEEWCQHPKVGQGKKRAMLEALRDHGEMTKADLADAVGMEPSGGSFERYLTALRSLDLIAGDRGAPLNINPDLL